MKIKNKIMRFLRIGRVAFPLMRENIYLYCKLLLHSSSTDRGKKSSLTRLVINSHVLEKGLTMPDRKLGFGYDRVRLLIKSCSTAIQYYSAESDEVQLALNDLDQYYRLHQASGFSLPTDIVEGIQSLLEYKTMKCEACYETTSKEYFKMTADFADFARQRKTVRWYSNDPVDNNTIIKALQLAQTAPSACNRQSVKVHILSGDLKNEVLKMHEGSRGFGNQADKLLLVTSDLRCWTYDIASIAYIDGGIFVMNLLYALHYYHINACTLNASFKISSRRKLAKMVGLEKAEIPIAFVLIGNAPNSFQIAGSQRIRVENIYRFV